MFYSQSVKGFFVRNAPADAIELTEEQYAEAFEAQACGKLLSVVDGAIVITDPVITDEQMWKRVRQQRDRLLSGSDITQLPDSPFDAAAWATYRQALRDIPQNQTDPNDIAWPEAPSGG